MRKTPLTTFTVRRWLCQALATRQQLGFRTQLLVALLIFFSAFVARSLHALDLAPVMYTEQQPFNGLTYTYDERAMSILRGDGLLDPYDPTPRRTVWLSQAPGYAIFLSAVYRFTSRDFFRAQVVQNLLNSLSPVVIFFIAGFWLGWRTGMAAGFLTAMSHHLAHISNFILPDALCALPILVAVWLLTLSHQQRRFGYGFYALAGLALGSAAWLRPQPMLAGPFFAVLLTLLAARRWQTGKQAMLLAVVALLTIAPITIKNYRVYGAFIPVSIGTGLNLWEGIGEASNYGFGAVAKDEEVAEQEADLYQNPAYGEAWSYPDGIERDRARVGKSLRVIRENPFWYAGVMANRAAEMMKYSAHAPLVYGTENRGSREELSATVPRAWQSLYGQSQPSKWMIGEAFSGLRPLLRGVQRIMKEAMLMFVLAGVALTLLVSPRRTGFFLIVPLYYFLLQSMMHTEFRYTLPMQYFLFTFAAVTWVIVLTLLARGINKLL